MPLVARLKRERLQLEVDLQLTDELVDPVRENLDIVVRIGRPDGASLVARRVAHQSLVCIASPDYLARAGTPRTPTELDDHEALLYRQRRDGWIRPGQLCTEDGPVEHAPSGSMTFSDGEAMAHAAVLGMGIAQVSSYMAMEALASGALVELLPHCRPPDMPIHAVMPEQSSQLARVRLFLDALAQAFEHP